PDQIVAALLIHHDALRIRFVHTESSWRQFIAKPDDMPPFNRIDLSTCPDSALDTAIAAAASAQQTSLDLSAGPLVRVAFFDLGPRRRGRLLFVIHHLIADAVSIRIL